MISSTNISTYSLQLNFSSTQSSDDLLKITTSARLALNTEPKSFAELNKLIKFLYPGQSLYAFEHFYPKAQKVLKGLAFQNLPGSLQRLTPIALNYLHALGPVEKTLASDPCIESMQHTLSHFIDAHEQFKKLFTLECENASPAASFTVLSRYPNTLRLYFTAFLNQLSIVSPKIYMAWKESIENSGEEVVDLFPRLAIYHLLENSQYPIPEPFAAQPEKIAALRATYDQLSASQKAKLLETICQVSVSVEQHEEPPIKPLNIDKDVHDLFLLIGRICSDIQTTNQTVFNGVIRIIYRETAKMFVMLDHMDVKTSPTTLASRSRALILSLLKQKILTANELPIDFSGSNTSGNIQEETLSAHANYQALSKNEKEEFNALLMQGVSSVKVPALNSLLQKFERIEKLFTARSTIFSLQILPALAYKRTQH